MKIPIDRSKKVIVLKWLERGTIDTADLKELSKGKNFFEELMRELPDDVNFERKTF